jgi:hypothetical protein
LGGDVADGEFLEYLPEVGRLAGAGEFFIEGPVLVVSHENTEAIPVKLDGEPVGLGHTAQEFGIAVQVLVRAEVEREDLPRGIVDRAHERGLAIAAEPGEFARVHEHHGSTPGLPQAAGTVLHRAAAASGSDPRVPSDTPQEFPRDDDPLHFAKLLREVMVVEAGIGGAGQCDDAAPNFGGQPPP